MKRIYYFSLPVSVCLFDSFFCQAQDRVHSGKKEKAKERALFHSVQVMEDVPAEEISSSQVTSDKDGAKNGTIPKVPLPPAEKADVQVQKPADSETKEKAIVMPPLDIKTQPEAHVPSDLDDTADDVNIDLHEANVKRFSPKKPKVVSSARFKPNLLHPASCTTRSY